MRAQATQSSWIQRIFFLLAVGIITISSGALANVPQELHYQGVLTDDNGDVVDCPDAFSCNGLAYDITFRLYDQAQGGNVIWEESHQEVSIRSGLFNVALGSFVPIQAESLSSGSVYLGVTINDTPELQPRQMVVSAAFSIRSGLSDNALNAAQLDGKQAHEFVTDVELSEALSDQGFQDGDDDTLALLSCDMGDMPVYDGGGWTCQQLVDNDTLMSLNCNADQVIRWTGQAWICDDETDTTLSDAQVTQIASDAGFVALADLAVVATTGQYSDLLGIPTAVSQLDTTADGELAFAGEPIISETGQWVGDPTGLMGPAGKDGATGIDGKDGANGLDGNDGINGLDGKDGAMGANGLDGKDGAMGAMGIDGKDGAKGIDGKDGANGLDGKDGAMGIDGKDGANGLDGKDGAKGIDGKDGLNGADGNDGLNGADGKDGAMGAKGIDGKDGATGPNGIDGKDGSNGLDGKAGAPGIDGKDGATGAKGNDGKDGVSVASTVVNHAGQLVITLTNGNTSTSGSLVGVPGVDGTPGLDGVPGADGVDGKDGVSVASAVVSGASELVITLTDGSVHISPSLRGAQGEMGEAGVAGKEGAPGEDGRDGVSVASTVVNNAGQLVITLSNGNTSTSESLMGQPGLDGVPGIDGVLGLDGKDGAPGAKGLDGIDGVGILSAIINAADQLVITLTDGTLFESDSLRGAKGDQGDDGAPGIDGKDGLNGAEGKDGLNGADGSDGTDGLTGPQGPPGQIGQGAQPTCDESQRGTQWFVQGASDVADRIDICGKNADDSYSWKALDLPQPKFELKCPCGVCWSTKYVDYTAALPNNYKKQKACLCTPDGWKFTGAGYRHSNWASPDKCNF